MKTSFYSRGKLLISGEYLILDGAEGLAIPCQYGQDLQIEDTDSNWFIWKSYTRKNKLWFWMQCPMDELFKDSIITETNHQEIAQNLLMLLRIAKDNNPLFLENSCGIQAHTHLEFPRSWGLGSSSTLLNNLGQWAQISPYVLLKNRFSGSGYDIACAQHNKPIIYQLIAGDSFVEEVDFNPSFADQLYFIHTDKKQQSDLEINEYRQLSFSKKDAVEQLDKLTQKMLKASEFTIFCEAVEEHENLLSKILNKPKIKDLLFPDFKGSIKSLGAWGGDFILACGDEKTPSYFVEKGLNTIIPFNEMLAPSKK